MGGTDSFRVRFFGGMDFMGKHLTKNDRIKMETMLNSGHKVTEVAAYLHVHRSTIYREMKRENIPIEIVTIPRK